MLNSPFFQAINPGDRRANAIGNPHMEGSLWSRLPEDLIERVLVWLPAANQMRLRMVCKKWRETLAFKCFLEASAAQVASYESYFVRISNREHSQPPPRFDSWPLPEFDKWYNVSISYLPPEEEVRFPVSSSSGLICFTQTYRSDNGPMIFVSNPLTKRWKKLPRLLSTQQPILMSMVVWKWPSNYKVIVAGDENTEIFDSVEGKWRITGCLPTRVLDVSRNRVVFCRGSLYCLTWDGLNSNLLEFSIQDEVWYKVKTSQMPGDRKFRNLVTCKGYIMIVGKSVVGKSAGHPVCVWLLEWKTMKWHEAGCMPQQVLNHFLGCRAWCFQCGSHGDIIFLTGYHCNMRLLVDPGQNMWLSVNSARLNLGDGFSFEPRLDSQV